jgi:hypothetical protein
MGGSSSRSTKHHFDAQDDECPRHLELAPCGRLRARVGELLRAVEGVGDPGTWPVRLQSGGSARSGPWGEPVLRQQSRRAVASGAEARPWRRRLPLAGCARPSRCAPRATRGRDRRAPGASEGLSRPQRRGRGVIEAIAPELRSSQPGPRTRLTPPSRCGGLGRMTSLRASLTAPGPPRDQDAPRLCVMMPSRVRLFAGGSPFTTSSPSRGLCPVAAPPRR